MGIDQVIDRAKVALHGRDGTHNIIIRADIHGVASGRDTKRLGDLAGNLFRLCTLDIEQGDSGPGPRQFFANRPSDAAGSASHDTGAALQIDE